MTKRLVLLCFALSTFGQTIRIQSTSTAIGQKGTATIEIESPSNKMPLAMQWDIGLPDGAIRMEASDIVAGAAAIRASKSVTCVSVSVPDGNSGLVYRCILAGGRTPIANGAVAVLSFTALANAQPGRYVLRVTRIEAVGRDVKGARLKDASSEILISK
jgi:hypothetical protein